MTEDFAAGRVRVVVATVAFGMGVHVVDLDAVVHASLPRSLEEYVQQIGRAGRGGSEAHCHAMLDDADYIRMRSLAFASATEVDAVRALLHRVFAVPAPESRGRPRKRDRSRVRDTRSVRTAGDGRA